MTRLNAVPRGRIWWRVLLGLIATFALIQLVPYGHAHSNPPVQASAKWDAPETRALFVRACADCHSNGTHWPWYSNVAPVSWLLEHHVSDGRSRFSVYVTGFGPDAKKAAEQVRNGNMPDGSYPPLHSEARLSAAEKTQLAAGLAATFGDEPEKK